MECDEILTKLLILFLLEQVIYKIGITNLKLKPEIMSAGGQPYCNYGKVSMQTVF